MISRLRFALGSLFTAVLLFSAQAYAGTSAPHTLGYQGRLTQSGVAVTGSVSVVFSLYAGASGGSVLWTETQPSVTVASGLYSTILGKITPFPAGLFNQPLYLGVKVGTDAEMTPRQELASTPYSERAASAALADSATTASTANALTGTALAQYGLTGGATNRATVITTIDSGGASGVGQYTSIALGLDGIPIIAYYDQTNHSLKTAKCSNTSCSGSATIMTIDGTASVGQYASITVPTTDGLPVISYFDASNTGLKVAKCSQPDCTGKPIITAVTAPGLNAGQFTSITTDTDGLPIISFADSTNSSNRIASCPTADCSTIAGTNEYMPSSIAAQYTSIAVGSDGIPVVSFYSATWGGTGVYKCNNLQCTYTGTPTGYTQLLTGGGYSFGPYLSMALGVDGFPIMAAGSLAGSPAVVHCTDPVCSVSVNIPTFIDTGGSYISTAIGSDGLPVISYYSSDAHLKFVKCTNIACTTFAVKALDTSGNVGQFTSLMMGADGLPIMSYYDFTNKGLKVAKCVNAWCTNYVGRR